MPLPPSHQFEVPVRPHAPVVVADAHALHLADIGQREREDVDAVALKVILARVELGHGGGELLAIPERIGGGGIQASGGE